MKNHPLSCWFRELLYPAGCACCGAPLLGPSEAFWGVCGPCARILIPEPGPRCLRCGRPLVSEKAICGECRDDAPQAHAGAAALFRYGGAARRLLNSYKFGSGRAASPFISRLLAQAVRENGPLIGGPFSVVPVPPRPGKLRKQGWDQVDLLAEHMSALESLPVNRCLRRLPSKTQKELGREDRIRNLRGRIVCASTPPQRAVIIDDVITTGATLSACSGALMEAGCVRVFALALCYD